MTRLSKKPLTTPEPMFEPAKMHTPVMSYGEMQAFRAEYWRYLSSEKCDCTESRHVACHGTMISFIENYVDKGEEPPYFRRVLERLQEFYYFTGKPEMMDIARRLILRVSGIQ